jgi:hypothetical protein
MVTRTNGALQEVRLRCDTLTIDADDGLAMLTWRGVVLLDHPAEPGVVMVDAQVAKSDSQMPAPLGLPDASLHSTISQPAIGAGTVSLPFIPGPPQVPNLGENAQKPGSSFPPPRNVPGTNRPQTMALSIEDAPAELKTILPFQSDSSETRKLPTARPEPPAIVYMPLASFDVPPPAAIASPVAVAPPAAIVVEKPAMVGPIVTLEKIVNIPLAEQPKSAVLIPQTPASESLSRNLTIAEHATIAAEFAEGKNSHADTLRAHELSADDWKMNDERWKKALGDEERHGKRKLREAHDGAYVTRVEGFRGKISLEEVARILVGFERRNAREVLD